MRSFRTITSLAVVTGAGYALFAMIGAPVATAPDCELGQSQIAGGKCIWPDNKTHDVPGGKVQCTQHSCVFRPDEN